MLNDQRPYLAETYEQIDLVRLGLALPFFDRAFLELILTAPVDGFLRHGFYNRWLAEFGRVAAGVPWQAYPGHESCYKRGGRCTKGHSALDDPPLR
jgi:hypothetical protein